MRNECSSGILVRFMLLYLLARPVQGKPAGQRKDVTNIIKSLRYNMQKVLHFIEHLNQDAQGRKTDSLDQQQWLLEHRQPPATYENQTENIKNAMPFWSSIHSFSRYHILYKGPKGSLDDVEDCWMKFGDKSRSVIPYDQRQLNHLLADESVIKATAKQAAQAVANSAKATLKTQKGVKQIAEGLIQLKNCLEEFEKTIKL